MDVRRRIGPALPSQGGTLHKRCWFEFSKMLILFDTEGRNMFEENKVRFNEKKDAAIQEICKHVSYIK